MARSSWKEFTPKLVSVLRQGYTATDFRRDAVAGLTVAIVALPLAMALAIASGTTPDKGLITAVVAGFLISLLGGSRVQIGGPTGAFVVVVFNVIREHGYDGLILATLMAGVVLLVAGFARLGTWIRYIPEPVVTGFTAGIAVIILTSQIKDIFGLNVPDVPAAVAEKLGAFWATRDTVNPAAIFIAAMALAMIVAMRRFAPRLPAFLIAVVATASIALIFELKVESIGSLFGGIPSRLPAPAIPEITFAKMQKLIPSALVIAFLAGVESLLSAMVADGMTGTRHRSNIELVGQGVANIASALFGGLPATGAIARTATNIRSGARSPVAGMMHALFLLFFMVAAAPLASFVPLATLGAVLVVVAWNMSDAPRFLHMMTAPLGDRLVLILTFSLTVLVDLTVAIEVGVVLAAILFMHRMAEVAGVQPREIGEPAEASTGGAIDEFQRADLPPGVNVFQMQGPLFFGVTHRLAEVLDRIDKPPRVFILRMRMVPFIDASGVSALAAFVRHCRQRGTAVILSGVQPSLRAVMARMHLGEEGDEVRFAPDFQAALELAREIAESPGAG